MKSIATRLNLGFAIGWIAVFLGLGIATTWAFRSLTEFYVGTRLEHDAESLLTALQFERQGSLEKLSLIRFNPVFEQPFSGHYFRIQVNQQQILSRSLWDQDFPAMPAVARGEHRLEHVTGPEGQRLLVFTRGYEKVGELVRISVAEDLSPMRSRVHELQFAYLIIGVVLLGLLLIWQRFTLNQSLRPLRESQRELRALEAGERQALSEDVPEEVRPFVAEVNRLVETLHKRLERSRHAMGNLAHALKTPLTRLGQMADDLAPASRDDDSVSGEVRGLLDTMRRQIDSELKRARLAGGAVAHGRIALDVLLQDLVEVLRRIYHDRELAFELAIPAELSYSADKEDMSELFGNLLDNAAKWARSRVRVQATLDEQQVLTVSIEDDGPGVDDGELAQLRGRGIRLDEQAAPGHGLGLSIVEEIVSHYDGELELGRSQALGGFRASVRLGCCPQD